MLYSVGLLCSEVPSGLQHLSSEPPVLIDGVGGVFQHS